MAGFNYEQNLPHQEGAIAAVNAVFHHALRHDAQEYYANARFTFSQNAIADHQRHNGISEGQSEAPIFDILMETGTGKTYTYTKTMLELHKNYGLFKFIVVVPTLSIKAGTKAFLESHALKQHIQQDLRYDSEIELYQVESQKSRQGKLGVQADLVRFIENTDQRKIHVLLINQGMLNAPSITSDTKKDDQQRLLADKYLTPLAGIAGTNPVVILDEPHKFKEGNKTWQSIAQLNASLMIRYGATFPQDKKGVVQYHNLIYRLTAVDAFNDNLVKGVRVFTTEVVGDKLEKVKLLNIEKNQATFGYGEKKITLGVGESLHLLHDGIDDLTLADINKKCTSVVLSSGLELKKGDSFSPYTFCNATTQQMLQKALKQHFDLERQLLLRDGGKIKPLTLFFIDDIDSFRNEDGALRKTFESYLKTELEQRLQSEQNPFYQQHLQTALADLSATCAGYFSKDNSTTDEKIAQEVQEILHDKEKLLDINNPRRFVFSKWTLREGWDNPNVFGICKLRSSGSEISKLQEVGRGLRLPVNEFMARVKDEQFKLNYFVDSSEQDFVEKLIGEINSQAPKITFGKELTDENIAQIQHHYGKSKFAILSDCISDQIIDEEQAFINAQSTQKLIEKYPLAFQERRLYENTIEKGDKKKEGKIPMRKGKYAELKALWETLNQKVILQYQFKNEEECLALVVQFLAEQQPYLMKKGIATKAETLLVRNRRMTIQREFSLDEERFTPLVEMEFDDFVQKLASRIFVKYSTLKRAFKALPALDIQPYLNEQTLMRLNKRFANFLLMKSFDQFQVGFNRIAHNVHPTKFTDKNGQEIAVNASDLGVKQTDFTPVESYLFDQIFYDSDLEKDNLDPAKGGKIEGVTVFTKIPKNAIKIPCAGGNSYSPDFAYIVQRENGDVLNFIVESKGVENEESLRPAELQKIKHAEAMFNQLQQRSGTGVKIYFARQFAQDKIKDLIKLALQNQ